MIYLNIHYEMRRHGLKGQQLAAVLGLPLNDVILSCMERQNFPFMKLNSWLICSAVPWTTWWVIVW